MTLEEAKLYKKIEIKNKYQEVLNAVNPITVNGVTIEFANGITIYNKLTIMLEELDDINAPGGIIRSWDGKQYQVSKTDFAEFRRQIRKYGVGCQLKKADMYDAVEAATTVEEVLTLDWDTFVKE